MTEVRRARATLALSQHELGRLLGVPWQTIARWERGSAVPIAYQRHLLAMLERAAARRPSSVERAREALRAGDAAHALSVLFNAAVRPEE